MRSGTLPAPLVVGFGEACAIAKQEMDYDSQWVKRLYTRLYNGIKEKIPHVILNGDANDRYVVLPLWFVANSKQILRKLEYVFCLR